MDQTTLNHLRQEDRKKLETLLSVVNGAMNALHRDECGDPAVVFHLGVHRRADFLERAEYAAALGASSVKTRYISSLPSTSRSLTLN